jgi:uncharacterized protein YbjT (DUF2867 family)
MEGVFMAARILVTGATGTVGSSLTRELAEKGIEVRAAIHDPVKAGLVKMENVETVALDYSKPKTVEAALDDIVKLYLLTPFVPDQVEIARMLVDGAKRAGVKYIVKQSGMGAEVTPGITVGRLHRQAEEYIEESGIPHTFLRPNFFMQNFINYFGTPIRTEGRLRLPIGDGKVSYVDARDVAAVGARVLTEDGHQGLVYNITGPEPLSLYEVAGILTKVLGRKIEYEDAPEGTARTMMKGAGMDDWAVDATMELHGICKAGFASGVFNSVEDITGNPSTTFEKFVRDNAGLFE